MSTEPTSRRWLFPAICLFLFALGLTLLLYDWTDVLPTWKMTLVHIGLGLTVGSFLLSVVWFLFLSKFSWKLRLGTLAGAILLIGAFALSVREVDFTGDMRPIFRYRWQLTAREIFDRSRQPSEGDLPFPFVEFDLQPDPLNDFPRYRGPNGDGVLTPPDSALFATDWEKSSPKILWRKPCGGGFSGFAVVGNAAFTLEQRREQEAIVCYDATTGDENWVYSYKALFSDTFGDGPRSTPTVHKGRVYTLGATGAFRTVDATNGRKLREDDSLDAGRPVTWGTSGSPLVVDDLNLVIIAPGGRKGPSLIAYDIRSGWRAWTGGEPGGGYSSPLLATLAGRRQVVLFDAGGLAGFDVSTGEELWRHKWKTMFDMNITQPVVLDKDRIFISSEASNGCAMLQIVADKDSYEARVLWENTDMSSKFSNPVALGGAIYGLSHGVMVCLDQETGKRKWRGKRYGHGQILAAGGTIIVLSEQGAVSIVAADSKAFKELGSLSVFNDKTWNTHALVGRRLFIRNAREMACIELPAR